MPGVKPLSRPWRRGLLIAGLTLFAGSAILVPQYNPVTRGPALGSLHAHLVWGELLAWRRSISEARQFDDGQWPTDIATLAPPEQAGLVEVSSPQPLRLEARVRNLPELGDLAGTQVLLDFHERGDDWTCRTGTPPMPERYLPLNCRAEGADARPPAVITLQNLLLGCILFLLLALLVLWLRHPLLGPGRITPGQLRRTPLGQLPQVDRLLRRFGRRQAVLQLAGINADHWKDALACATGGDGGDRRFLALAQRLGTTDRACTDWNLPGEVHEWALPAELPISLARCLVYAPAAELEPLRIIEALRQTRTGLDVLLVLTDPAGQGGPLATHCADPANLLVAVDGASQSEWLLADTAAAAQSVLLRLLAAQLRVTRISPYQTRGGVVRSNAFFGRAQILTRVLNREPANYLVVGGRQLGKSSLLKAVQRRLQGHPQVACHYLSLRDHRLAPRLALQFGLPATSPLEQVIDHLTQAHGNKRLFLLIDEADLFFRDEAAHGYPQLSALRALSDEGRCWFMLAGFWDLYATAVLDYQSPLRNFGEVLTIGGLEPEACRELATVPLAGLRLGFASDGLVETLVQASGQRANLVAILCQECLEALEPGARIIEARHLARALDAQATQDALAGWTRLSHDEAACRLDRIAVYHAAQHDGHTSLTALADHFASHGRQAPADALQRALARLQLAYVLRREDGSGAYRFAIPLFARQFDQEETRLLLAQELAALPAAPRPDNRPPDEGA